MLLMLLAHITDHPHIHPEETFMAVAFAVVAYMGLKRLAGKGRF